MSKFRGVGNYHYCHVARLSVFMYASDVNNRIPDLRTGSYIFHFQKYLGCIATIVSFVDPSVFDMGCCCREVFLQISGDKPFKQSQS